MLAPTKTFVLVEESEQMVMNRAHGVDLVVNVTLVTLCLYSKVRITKESTLDKQLLLLFAHPAWIIAPATSQTLQSD